MYLRPYEPEDFDAVFALDEVCFAPPYRFTRAVMRHVVTRRGAVMPLACERDATGAELLLGFCAVNLERQGSLLAGYVATLDVAPASRGRGLGTLLMRRAEEQIRVAGAAGIGLHVSVSNEAAIRLYESLGYLRQRHEADFYARGLHTWVYWKPLV